MNRRIPSVTVGILLFFAVPPSPPAMAGSNAAVALTLVAELQAEAQDQAALIEARRAALLQPDRPLPARAAPPDTGPPSAAAVGDATGRQSSPARALVRLWVGFYRRQISPAIGTRCSMIPSCSEYCLTAVRRHGWLGLTMYADRAVREPSVIRDARHPVRIGERVYYADPLSDHDFWHRQRQDPDE